MTFMNNVVKFTSQFVQKGLGLLFIFIISWCGAQTISRAEYFFDTDPGPGNGTAISFTAGNPVTFTGTISTTGLAPGYHYLFIRTKTSSGNWSLYEGRQFFIDGGIVAAEYFFDADPGIGNATPLAVSSSSTITGTISSTGISDGVHYLFIRTKHDGNIWSLAEPRYVNIRTRIVEAEYFIDTDPGFGNGTPLSISSPSDLITISPTIATPLLPNGNHYLFIRTKDISGRWSFFEPQMFTVDAALPIELYDFSATALRDGKIKLQWTTASEINNDFYSVERAAEKAEFSEIFQVQGAGTTTRSTSYEQIDQTPAPGVNYYRLKQFDFDGTYTYSNIVSAEVKIQTTVYPNPVIDQWSVILGNNSQGWKTLEVLDLSGRILATYKTELHTLELSRAGIPAGSHMLRITSPGTKTEIVKLSFK